MSEKDFQQQILDLARVYRWRSYHTHDSRHSAAGFPDLVLVRGPELLFAELKTETGKVSDAQADWIADLERVASSVQTIRDRLNNWTPGNDTGACVEVFVWRPSDWDAINTRLAHRAGVRG